MKSFASTRKYANNWITKFEKSVVRCGYSIKGYREYVHTTIILLEKDGIEIQFRAYDANNGPVKDALIFLNDIYKSREEKLEEDFIEMLAKYEEE